MSKIYILPSQKNGIRMVEHPQVIHGEVYYNPVTYRWWFKNAGMTRYPIREGFLLKIGQDEGRTVYGVRRRTASGFVFEPHGFSTIEDALFEMETIKKMEQYIQDGEKFELARGRSMESDLSYWEMVSQSNENFEHDEILDLTGAFE